MTEGPHREDPSWFSGRTLLWMFVPGWGVRQAQRGEVDALGMLRGLFTAFAMALVLIGAVVALLASGGSDEGSVSTGAVAMGVAGYGIASLVIPRLIERPLDCSTPEALVAGYRTRFFLRIAFADAAALVGFVGFFLTGDWRLYPLGAFFSFLGFVRLAPTQRNLEREQDALNASGCGQSLLHVLKASRS